MVSAGTSDLPVAEEAAVVAEAFGHPVERLVDVGVAGLHRLLAAGEQLQRARVRDRGGGYGGRAAQRRRRHGERPGNRGADQCRLWRLLRWPGRAARQC